MWAPLSTTAKFALIVSFLAMLENDPEFIECMKKQMEDGKTKEEAKKICRRKEYAPAEVEVDEIARSKRLMSNLESTR